MSLWCRNDMRKNICITMKISFNSLQFYFKANVLYFETILINRYLKNSFGIRFFIFFELMPCMKPGITNRLFTICLHYVVNITNFIQCKYTNKFTFEGCCLFGDDCLRYTFNIGTRLKIFIEESRTAREMWTLTTFSFLQIVQKFCVVVCSAFVECTPILRMRLWFDPHSDHIHFGDRHLGLQW